MLKIKDLWQNHRSISIISLTLLFLLAVVMILFFTMRPDISTVQDSIVGSAPPATMRPTQMPAKPTSLPTAVVKSTKRPTPKPTLVPPTAMPEPTPTAVPTATTVSLTNIWEIVYYDGATEVMREWKFEPLNPYACPVFPNVDHAGYLASDGLEYGKWIDIFCQQDEKCNFIVPTGHYRLYTGDGAAEELEWECHAGTITDTNGVTVTKGCALFVVNVGNVTANYEDVEFESGFTVSGRYWNGEKLPQAIWRGTSFAAYNMLNLSGEETNAGANCSVRDGCGAVEVTFIVISGNELLMRGTTTFFR